MSYQVLARKWRPRSFETLVGQEHVVRALVHALDHQRLHHAYLFTGTRGVGKTTLARILAKALNCETGVTSQPCGQCATCLEIDAGRFVDLIEVDAATNTKVDEMRQLLENAAYAPTSGRFKVYVIDEVHMLSNSAFNAMLKTLEEPPEHIKFILATTDPQKIPVTVLSRCLQFNLKQMPLGKIVEHLERILEAEQVSFEPAALKHLAKGAAGSMRDALSLLDQAIAHGAGAVRESEVRDMLGTIGDDHLHALLDGLVRRDFQELLSVAAAMDSRSLSFDAALQELATQFHRIALVQQAPQAIPDEDERQRLLGYAQHFDAEFVQLCYQILITGRNDLALAPDEYSGFLMTLMRLLAFDPRTPSGLPLEVPQATAPQPRPAAAQSSASVGKAAASPAPQQRSVPEHDWSDLVEALKLGGLVRELASHCMLLERAEQHIRLQLDPQHKSLLMHKGLQEKLQGALVEHFGTALRLSIETGPLNGQTPAQRTSQVARDKQDSARNALEQDPVVREMMETFDATISPQTIRPLN